MDAAARLEVIRELCSFEERLAGTDAERRAGDWLAERLRRAGRRAEVEPTYVHPQVALTQAAHCLLGFAGSLVAILSPPAGFAIVLAAALAMYLDLNARFYLVRRLFFRRASQNVVSPGPMPDAPARLLLLAHYDAARSGPLFRRRTIARLATLARLTRLPLSPSRILFWSLAALLPILGARMAGLDSGLISVLQLIPTLILLFGILMLVNVELSDVAPGANDNASGVATVLSLAEELASKPPENLDVSVVLIGGGECLMEGTRAFVRSHRDELRGDAYFVNVEAVGRGAVRYVTGEGMAVSFGMDRRVIELCDAIADSGGARPEGPLAWGFATASLPLRLARCRGTTVTTIERGSLVPAAFHRLDDVPGGIDATALDDAHRFTLELVRAIDRDVGRRLAR
ncbi:MAG: M28 family peptidase [Solirubrobacterales bacterium]